MAPSRIPYHCCPLCESRALSLLRDERCDWHPCYREGLPPTMRWLSCGDCGHVFVDGYFNDEALTLLFSEGHLSQSPGHDDEAQRYVWATSVERVTTYLDCPLGRWLDVGLGNGSLLFTAEEWGYTPVGLDLRPSTAAAMAQFGIECYCADLGEHTSAEGYQVISFCDVLEHVPYPTKTLAHARRLLDEDGLLVVSMPNCASQVWKSLDRAGANPYWGEIEHYHNFSRARLVQLLDECGFDFVSYSVSHRWRVTMEVIARKRD
jgi:SAM-dependent methyltransferase